MPPVTPYSGALAGREPLAAMRDAIARFESIIAPWSAADYERSYAPGKWTARQLLTHLVHVEMVFSERIRFALTTSDYVVVPFEQDDWMKMENIVGGATACAAYLALRRMNLEFFRSLTPAQRGHRFRHPERGEIDVNWIITALAGHDRHHLPQLETAARQ